MLDLPPGFGSNPIEQKLRIAQAQQDQILVLHVQISSTIMAQLIGLDRCSEEDLNFAATTSVQAASILLERYGITVKLPERSK